MILFFDTETTGFVDSRLPADHPSQPHLVQLGALLCDDDGRERGSLSLIIRPDGYEIPEKVSAIHGITTEIAARTGVPLKAAVDAFTGLRLQAHRMVGHNIRFDLGVMKTAFIRAECEGAYPGPTDIRCTMSISTPVINLPPTDKMLAAGINRPKSPKLEECIAHFFGETLDGAHDAMVDVRACKRVYFKLLEQGHIQ